jgi:hypothetical protein
MKAGDEQPDFAALGLTMRRLVRDEFARDCGARADFTRYMDQISDRVLSGSGPLPDQQVRAMEVAEAILRLKDELLRPSALPSRPASAVRT